MDDIMRRVWYTVHELHCEIYEDTDLLGVMVVRWETEGGGSHEVL